MTKGTKGLQKITHSQGQLDIWLGSCAQNETNALILFMHSYNQHKQKIKHNKIQLEQECSL